MHSSHARFIVVTICMMIAAATPVASQPTIAVSPDTLTGSAESGTNIVVPLIIENTGTGTLNWTVGVFPGLDGLDILIDKAHMQAIDQEFVDILVAYGATVTVNSSQTVTSSLLAPYDVFVTRTPRDPFTDAERDAIEAFVLAGGNLYYAVGLTGFNYRINQIFQNAGMTIGSASGIAGTTTNILSHPITSNVTSLKHTGYWFDITSVPSGGKQIVKSYGGNDFIAAAMPYGAGRMIFSEGLEEAADLSPSSPTDNRLYVLQAFQWFGGDPPSWLSLSTFSGATDAGLMDTVSVTMDATGLFEDDYPSLLIVHSDAGNAPMINVPIDFHVYGDPGIAATPSSVDFGIVYQALPAMMNVSIENYGVGNLTVTDIDTPHPDFVVLDTAFTVTPMGSHMITIDFNPSVDTTFVDSILVSSDDPANPVFAIPLTAQGSTAPPPPDIAVVPDNINYGVVYVGYPAQAGVLFLNNGIGDLTVTDITVPHPDFSLSDTAFVISPGGYKDVTIFYSPSNDTMIVDTLYALSDDPDTPAYPIAVNVEGSSASPPVIGAAPNPLVGAVAVEPTQQLLTISNTGGATLSWQITPPAAAASSAGFPAWFDITPTSGTIAPDSAQVLTATYTRSGLAAGSYNSSFTIESNDVFNPSTGVNIAMNVSDEPRISISETMLVYPDIYVGTTIEMGVNVENVGDATLSVSTSTTNANYLAITTGFNLSPGQIYYDRVRFIPTSDGTHNGSIVITSNDPTTDTLFVPITGRALDPSNLVASADTISDQMPPGSARNHTLTVDNTGAADGAYQVQIVYGLPPSASPPQAPARPLEPWETATITGKPAAAAPAAQAPAKPQTAATTTEVIPFHDGFEDGNYTGWSQGAASATRTVTNLSAADGTVYSLRETNAPSGHQTGLYVDFGAITPAYTGFWVRSGSQSTYDCYVTWRDSNGTEVIFFFATGTGTFYINDDVGGNQVYAYQADTWYHIEFKNIDFVAKTFDYWVDDLPVQTGVPMRNAGSVSDIARLDIYNYEGGSEGWWDEISVSGVSPTWLTVTPSSGVFATGEQAEFQVKFNAVDLPAGQYDAAVTFRSALGLQPLDLFTVSALLDVDSVLTGAGDEQNLPTDFALHPNYPNPFNPSTQIRLDLPSVRSTSVIVFDVAGRRVRTLLSGTLPAGRHTARWDGTDENGRRVASGVYFCRMVAGDFTQTRKMILLK